MEEQQQLSHEPPSQQKKKESHDSKDCTQNGTVVQYRLPTWMETLQHPKEVATATGHGDTWCFFLLYEDNDSTIKIVNHDRPTDRARHIEIRYFGLQQWRALGDIIMRHIPGIINPADDLTKALGWVLHARHARFIMGHFRFQPTNPSTSTTTPTDRDLSPQISQSPALDRGGS